MIDLYELTIEEDKDEVFAISLVNTPAMDSDFVLLSKEEKEVHLSAFNEEKQLIVGAVMIPNKAIYRRDGDKEYNIYFSKDTVEKASELFLQKENNSSFTLEHNGSIDNVSVVQSWLSTGDESRYGLDNIKEGTWMIAAKVNSKEMWNYVKQGDVYGFSLEGRFTDKLRNDKRVETYSDQKLEAALEKIEEIILEYNDTLELSEVKLESFGGYPDSAKSAARGAIEANKRNNNKCATNVGKIRARQIARGEKFTISTVKRIYSYLSRAAEYYDPSDQNACGTISYRLWGGKSMLGWSRKILRGKGLLKD
jgi:hypothetical protein